MGITSGGWCQAGVPPTVGGMLKRTAAASLWFLATWVGYEIVWSMTDVPRMLGPLLAGGAALIVMIDPVHLFWPRPTSGPREAAVVGSFETSLPTAH